ncbi:SpoIIE family protein phosphatase [Cyanobium sp. T1G-Tous]|uniref:ATP-binding SpoIIE family protein phosphatase n=1 Tax=Cyanobium sp. T1G-Tous TaxID=2823722 RepID=UPI0020CC8C3D|nr:ATP-binding SpoIIE family protein phosphatase [Cyanobium sp. T1G-Tous]MCP9804514.1 SpoIIE family protein phosphatase [Cyanobium sp. T1G-Tous]
MHNVNTRHYRIQRRSDVQIAAVSMQRKDYYPSLSSLDRSSLGTVIAELGTNILKYGEQGIIRISEVEDGLRIGILIEAIDKGPGIPDLDRALEDHFSTGNSLGLGLPAVKRMSDDLAIVSSPGKGTEVRALRWIRLPAVQITKTHTNSSASLPPASHREQTIDLRPQAGNSPCVLNFEQRIRACYPERVSGDQILTTNHAHLWLLAVVDGCGHGPGAHAVAHAVVEGMQQRFEQLAAELSTIDDTETNLAPACPAEQWLSELLRTAHQLACGSRGAAIGLSLIDTQRWEMWFSGIGNTRILQFKPRGWTGVSRDGQLGDRFPTPMVQHFPLNRGDTVVQFSDGLRESQVRQLRQNTDPKLPIAALADLLMSQALRSDDASVLVMGCQA